ncbi:methyltransferase domain-containing protein [Aliikangiella sp. IMCC44632]
MASNSFIYQLADFIGLKPNPVIDLRSREAFAQGHYSDAANFPVESIISRLYQLPTKSSLLYLIGTEQDINEATRALNQKGYAIGASLVWSVSLAAQLKAKHLLSLGEQSPRLWQPAPVIERLVKSAQTNSANPLSGLRALDIGCGGGRDAVYLALHGCQVVAVDYQQAAISKVSELAKQHSVKVTAQVLDLEIENNALDQIDGEFDIISVVRYLHRPLLSQIKRKLKPHGFVAYQTFSEGCEAFGKPKNPRFILKNGELAKVFSDFKILCDETIWLNDGRPNNVFIAQKLT